MRKYLLILVLIAIAGKYGYDYLLSDDFERYADRTKQPLTCQFENVLGYMHIVMSTYQSGYYRFSHVLDRCPDTPMAETAMFEMAHCLENMGRNAVAAGAYEAFIAKYPNSDKTAVAQKSSDILRGR